MIPKLLVLFCVCNVIASNTFNLRNVGDDDLLQLIKAKDKLVVLFTKPNCETCIQYEQSLESLDEELSKELSIESVRVENSHLCRLYSPSKEPAVVFFRHGIPLLYSGGPDDNEIFTFFEQNQQPAVKELTDKIFEHITQAATGATTGDWFVMFYGASCVECQRLHAVWEGVGASLRGRVNVARVDANLAGLNTAKRFQVDKLPTFLFFRLGKVYKYDLAKHDVKSFVHFAQGGYKNYKAVPVPLLASPFDDIVDWCVEWIKYSISFGLNILAENPWIWQVSLLCVAGFGLVGITAIIALCKARSNVPKVVKKEKKSK